MSPADPGPVSTPVSCQVEPVATRTASGGPREAVRPAGVAGGKGSHRVDRRHLAAVDHQGRLDHRPRRVALPQCADQLQGHVLDVLGVGRLHDDHHRPHQRGAVGERGQHRVGATDRVARRAPAPPSARRRRCRGSARIRCQRGAGAERDDLRPGVPAGQPLDRSRRRVGLRRRRTPCPARRARHRSARGRPGGRRHRGSWSPARSRRRPAEDDAWTAVGPAAVDGMVRCVQDHARRRGAAGSPAWRLPRPGRVPRAAPRSRPGRHRDR